MSRSIRIKGPGSIAGALRVPGDKSISHRIAMLASLARGDSVIRGFASSADCHSTLQCLKKLGVEIKHSADKLVIRGRGPDCYRPGEPQPKLSAGNSGSTMRMLSGLLAGQPFVSVIDGDNSLRRRPMARIIEPLTLMGAQISARENKFAPLEIHGGNLKAINYASAVASAQVKSCVLFAGLLASGRTQFIEPARSRNHSELMLRALGAKVDCGEERHGFSVSLEGRQQLSSIDYEVPGDLSSAAFFIAATSVLPDSQLSISGVSLNESRTAFIDVLGRLGAKIETRNLSERHGEPVGDLEITASHLKSSYRGLLLSGEIIPNIIDEIPILAVVGTQVEGGIEVRDAGELRVKESDRIRTVVDGVRALGGTIEEFQDGFAVRGQQRLKGGPVETAGDHRIAMAFSVAGLVAEGVTEIRDADCVKVSFPEFYDLLSSVVTSGGALDDRNS